jgi:hypothetical protein
MKFGQRLRDTAQSASTRARKRVGGKTQNNLGTADKAESKRMTPRLDTAEATKFLRGLGAPRVLVAIHPDNGMVHAAYVTTCPALTDFLKSYSDRNWNCYFTPNRTKRALTCKPRKVDIKWFDFAHVELDPTDAINDLQGWQKRTRAKLKNSKWPPTFIWSSGNGIQALWRIDPPVLLANSEIIADCESRNRGLLEIFKDGEIDVQGTWNVDRILRIPGTINFPNKKKRAAGRTVIGAGHVESF